MASIPELLNGHVTLEVECLDRWYRARLRWAEMVEGRGIRNWEEGLYRRKS